MSLCIIQSFNEDSSEITKRSFCEAIVSFLEQYSAAIAWRTASLDKDEFIEEKLWEQLR